jgi:hypothetical protein
MADTHGILIAETDLRNARIMIAGAGFGNLAATIRALPPQSHELQFF